MFLTEGMIDMLCEQRKQHITDNVTKFVCQINNKFISKIPYNCSIINPDKDIVVKYVPSLKEFMEVAILYSNVEGFFVITISNCSYSLVPSKDYLVATKILKETINKW